MDKAPAGANIQIILAGNEDAYRFFKKELGDDRIKYSGWLTYDEMISCIASCNCNLVVACSKERDCIPSKFYELCTFGRPIWIIGEDGGVFDSLMDEWQHTRIAVSDPVYQQNALSAAINGDCKLMFNMENCSAVPLTPPDMYNEYIKLIPSV